MKTRSIKVSIIWILSGLYIFLGLGLNSYAACAAMTYKSCTVLNGIECECCHPVNFQHNSYNIPPVSLSGDGCDCVKEPVIPTNAEPSGTLPQNGFYFEKLSTIASIPVNIIIFTYISNKINPKIEIQRSKKLDILSSVILLI